MPSRLVSPRRAASGAPTTKLAERGSAKRASSYLPAPLALSFACQILKHLAEGATCESPSAAQLDINARAVCPGIWLNFFSPLGSSCHFEALEAKR